MLIRNRRMIWELFVFTVVWTLMLSKSPVSKLPPHLTIRLFLYWLNSTEKKTIRQHMFDPHYCIAQRLCWVATPCVWWRDMCVFWRLLACYVCHCFYSLVCINLLSASPFLLLNSLQSGCSVALLSSPLNNRSEDNSSAMMEPYSSHLQQQLPRCICTICCSAQPQ